MSVLSEARRMLGDGPPSLSPGGDYWTCSFCTARLPEDDTDDRRSEKFTHIDGCAWLAMPQIIAALEAPS